MADPNGILEALRDQLSVIGTTAPYKTGIGQTIYLYDVQRQGLDLPSIAIGTRNFQLDRTDEQRNGRNLSTKSRGMDLIVEAAVQCEPEDAQRLAIDMLADIERAMAVVTGAAPLGTFGIRFSTAQILDRPSGVEGVVLQIIGSADFQFRP